MRAFLGVCLALAGLGGCVVPVGPEWTDPESNYPPTVHSANPPIGSVVAGDPLAGTPPTVEVMLADKNTDDNLFVRWLIDYPPFDKAVLQLAYETIQPGGGEVVRPQLSFSPSCATHQIATGFSNHRLMLAASDRPFLSAELGQPALDVVPDGNFVTRAVWQFELTCP